MSIDELQSLAEGSANYTLLAYRMVEVDAKQLLAMITVIDAAKAMRSLQSWPMKYHSVIQEFDAALSALEQE